MKTLARMKGKVPQVAEEDKAKPNPDEQDLAEALAKAIDDSIENGLSGKYKKIGGFHPSNTNDCARYLVYLFRGTFVPSDVSARLQRIFDNGHATHSRLYGYLEQMGILIADEVPINTILKYEDYEIPIEGTTDGLINWQGEKIIELKSISDAGFAQRRLFKKPKADHYKQIQIYMMASDINSGFVIYENKNTQQILVFEVTKDEEFMNKLLKKYGKIYKAFKEGKLPKRYKSPSSEHCRYCNLKDHCWSDEDAGVSI